MTDTPCLIPGCPGTIEVRDDRGHQSAWCPRCCRVVTIEEAATVIGRLRDENAMLRREQSRQRVDRERDLEEHDRLRAELTAARATVAELVAAASEMLTALCELEQDGRIYTGCSERWAPIVRRFAARKETP